MGSSYSSNREEEKEEINRKIKKAEDNLKKEEEEGKKLRSEVREKNLDHLFNILAECKDSSEESFARKRN